MYEIINITRIKKVFCPICPCVGKEGYICPAAIAKYDEESLLEFPFRLNREAIVSAVHTSQKKTVAKESTGVIIVDRPDYSGGIIVKFDDFEGNYYLSRLQIPYLDDYCSVAIRYIDTYGYDETLKNAEKLQTERSLFQIPSFPDESMDRETAWALKRAYRHCSTKRM
ncbi:MAG: hypothetical protein WC616_01425 [Candidatus Omnitrophota bacterium]